MFFFYFLGLFALYCVIYFVIQNIIRPYFKRKKYQGDVSERLASAGAGGDLSIRFEAHIDDKSHLTITAADAHYLNSKKGKTWREWIAKSLKKGCTIDYIFVDTNENDLEFLKQISQDYRDQNYKGKFTVKILNHSQEAEKLKKQFQTYHPTLLDTSDARKKRLWIEQYHSKTSNYADDVLFLAPSYKDFDVYYTKIQNEIKALNNNSTIYLH